MPIAFILLGIFVIVLLYGVGIYNALQMLKTRITASIQEIGNQLKRQANLIPNLQETVKAYLKHEKGIFELLTSARSAAQEAVRSGSSAAADKAADAMQKLLPKIQVLVESNPELKSNVTVTNFMDELRDTADKLMYSRRTLIELSREYNEKLVVFPSSLIANMFGFTPEKGLSTPMTGAHVEVSEEETKDVKVSL